MTARKIRTPQRAYHARERTPRSPTRSYLGGGRTPGCLFLATFLAFFADFLMALLAFFAFLAFFATLLPPLTIRPETLPQ
jgi:hypothetical protein